MYDPDGTIAIDTEPGPPPPAAGSDPEALSGLNPPLFRTLSRRHRRILAFLVPLAVIAAVWVVEFNRQHDGARRLVNEITNAGGMVLLKSRLIDRLSSDWTDRLTIDMTYVSLYQSTIDGDWLRAHDDLAEFDIDALFVGDSPLSGADVARLVEHHQIKTFCASEVTDCDVIANVLSTKDPLWGAMFNNSDLTDTGLRMLPLENLRHVGVANSAVTSDGLRELRRCRQLVYVDLDGHQFDNSVAELLRELQQIQHVYLFGKDVTDENLARIENMNVRSVVLTGTSVTQQGIASLQQVLPKCRIRVDDAPDPPSEETASD